MCCFLHVPDYFYFVWVGEWSGFYGFFSSLNFVSSPLIWLSMIQKKEVIFIFPRCRQNSCCSGEATAMAPMNMFLCLNIQQTIMIVFSGILRLLLMYVRNLTYTQSSSKICSFYLSRAAALWGIFEVKNSARSSWGRVEAYKRLLTTGNVNPKSHVNIFLSCREMTMTCQVKRKKKIGD